MTKKILLIIIMFISPVHSIAMPFGRVINTEWIKQKTLKIGMFSTLCLSQSLTGLTEGYRFQGNNGNYIVNQSNYHVYETLRRSSWVATGWMGYANWKSAHLTRWGKVRRYLGSVLVARNFFEWSYKYQRYGNPFDSSPERNRHAMVYFKLSKGKIVDAYISTGRATTPLVDIAFLVLGIWIFE